MGMLSLSVLFKYTLWPLRGCLQCMLLCLLCLQSQSELLAPSGPALLLPVKFVFVLYRYTAVTVHITRMTCNYDNNFSCSVS